MWLLLIFSVFVFLLVSLTIIILLTKKKPKTKELIQSFDARLSNLYVVYLINCNLNEHWDGWFLAGLNLASKMNAKKIYIECVVDSVGEIKKKIKMIMKYSNVKNVEINYHIPKKMELGEFYGLNQAWLLAQRHSKPSDLICFFHSKGISHGLNNWKETEFYTKKRWVRLLTEHDKIKKIFWEKPEIDIVGWCMQRTRPTFAWITWFWVRGSYLKHNKEPPPDETAAQHTRYYYEVWLASNTLNKGDNFLSMAHEVPLDYEWPLHCDKTINLDQYG